MAHKRNHWEKRLCIGIEHPLRELDQSVLIELGLSARGIHCDIGSILHNIHFKLNVPHGAVISPWGYGDHEYDYIFGHSDGLYSNYAKIVFWQEQVLFDEAIKKMFPKGRSFERVDAHLVWGNRFARGLVASGVSPEDIFIVGSPRIDLLHPSFRRSYLQRSSLGEEFGIKADVPWHFFPCSFGFNFMLPSVKRILVNQGFDNLNELVDRSRHDFEQFVELIRMQSRELGQAVSIVVRPHPSEPEAAYRNKLVGLQNVTVCKKYPVSWWLNASDFVVPMTSTTALEAAILAKKVLILEFDENRQVHFDFRHLFPKVSSSDALTNAIEGQHTSDLKEFYGDSYQPLQAYLVDSYGYLDGLSHQRIAHVMDVLTKDRQIAIDHRIPNLRGMKNLALDAIKSMLLGTSGLGRALAPTYYARRKTDYLRNSELMLAKHRYRSIVDSLSENAQLWGFTPTEIGTMVDIPIASRKESVE